MPKEEYIAELKSIYTELVALSRQHRDYSDDKQNREDEWFVLGWTMGPMTNLLDSIRVLSDSDKHAAVAIVSRSLIELMGLFIWTTGSKENAKKYRMRVSKLSEAPKRIWDQIMQGNASNISNIGQPKNDVAYHELIAQSGLPEGYIKTLDQNYDILSLYVHPSPIIAKGFAYDDQEQCQYYAKMALFSIQMVVSRSKDLKIIDPGKADLIRKKIKDLIQAIVKSQEG